MYVQVMEFHGIPRGFYLMTTLQNAFGHGGAPEPQLKREALATTAG
jgi:hypothetical protein